MPKVSEEPHIYTHTDTHTQTKGSSEKPEVTAEEYYDSHTKTLMYYYIMTMYCTEKHIKLDMHLNTFLEEAHLLL